MSKSNNVTRIVKITQFLFPGLQIGTKVKAHGRWEWYPKKTY